jgi:hypothetical protein
MKHWALILTSAVLLWSCGTKPSGADRYLGTYLTTGVLRGNMYIDSLGNKCALRTVQSFLVNDTTVPINLRLQFPDTSFHFHQQANQTFKVFVLSDSLAVQLNFDSCDVSGDIKLFKSGKVNAPSEIEFTIPPHQSKAITLILLFNENCKGVIRTELFSRGHLPALILPDTEKQIQKTENGFFIRLGITKMPEPKDTEGYSNVDYCTLPCGKVMLK